MPFTLRLLSLLFLLLTLQLQAQKINPAQIDELVNNNIEGVVPGLAVGIVKDGQIVYEQYLGYANLEHEVKIDEKTRFNIASNAKQFTALCILKLIEQGKIDLDDDFRKYLPNVHSNIPEKITISNLITHTSGIRDYCDLLGLQGKTWWKQFIDNGDVIELLEAQRDLNFKPGTEYLYSNSNYILLAEIVRKVTGQKFSEFAKAMFEDLGMPNTSFHTHYGEVTPNKAKPYGNWNVWREEPTITEVHGDGALFTTLKDQLQWEQIVQQNNGQYLSQKLINKSQTLIENSIENNYGYGLFFDAYKGLNLIHHDGVTGAYNATFLRFPMEKISIVVMSNNRNLSANYIAMQIAGIIFDKDDLLYPDNPDKVEQLASLQEVLGNYQNEDGSIIKIREKNGSIYREMYQRDPIKLINEQGALFEYETIKDLKMNFTNIGQDNQQFTIYKSSQPPSTYYKLPKSDLDAFDKNELDGRFYNDETDTEIIIKHLEGNTYAITKNGRKREAKLILEDYLRMMAFYHIKVIRDEENKVVGLNVERDRIKNVIFNRT